ncbi:MAG: ABC transporter ATP-binding protein [Phycisphaerales bacterium]
MATVRLSGVNKSYPNGVVAVKDFNLQTADGEFVVFVGPSGCGKSTTLRMIAGLEEITAGEISIGERVVNKVHPKDRDIAMVFQNYALYPHMTVYKNMAFALSLRGIPKAEIQRRVNHAATMLGLEGLLDRKPKALSGGQRQRVAVGRAIVREPKAFLFDEPLSNLDAKLRITTRTDIKALQQRLKTTTIYVTHDQEEAMTLGDRIVVMHGGLIQQAAPPMEVYRRPANRFVAGFVGTPPMNFVPALLERAAGGGLVAVEHAGAAAGVPARLNLPERTHAALAGRLGQEVVVGFRPQSLADVATLNGHASGAGATLSVRVDVVEPLGDVMDAIGATPAGTRIVARTPVRDGLAPGTMLTLTIDPAAVHVFEPGDFGRNLTL